MEIKITRIDDSVVTVELDNGTILDIARRWFDSNIEVGQELEFDVNDK